mmetsp:Transcript_13010/g.33283  ORF Transcript_13010/g.33283 Transcript_13010/m.33283 type:complete len:300 (+) Transcript_13010:3-902(+)
MSRRPPLLTASSPGSGRCSPDGGQGPPPATTPKSMSPSRGTPEESPGILLRTSSQTEPHSSTFQRNPAQLTGVGQPRASMWREPTLGRGRTRLSGRFRSRGRRARIHSSSGTPGATSTCSPTSTTVTSAAARAWRVAATRGLATVSPSLTLTLGPTDRGSPFETARCGRMRTSSGHRCCKTLTAHRWPSSPVWAARRTSTRARGCSGSAAVVAIPPAPPRASFARGRTSPTEPPRCSAALKRDRGKVSLWGVRGGGTTTEAHVASIRRYPQLRVVVGALRPPVPKMHRPRTTNRQTDEE